MISLDWKERLKNDTLDFYERKLPHNDFDIDIVYNAYPQRIDNKIPHAVITLVGKTIAGKIGKKADQFIPFYDYLLENKGENGFIIFSYIMAKAVRYYPEKFLLYLEDKLFSIDNQKEVNFIIDKAVYPVFKKEATEHLDLIVKWVKKDNQHIDNSLYKILRKLMVMDNSLISVIFSKLETSWLYATPNMIKLNSKLLKEIYKLDKEYYLSIFENYHNTRNPIFAEILSGAICEKNDTIVQLVESWTVSGNIKLKKIGLHSQKLLKKKG